MIKMSSSGKYLSGFILLVNICLSGYANKWQDSVLSVLPGLKDSVRVDCLNKLADSFSESNTDKSGYYAGSAMHLADSIMYGHGKVISRDNLGYIFLLTARYEKAVNIYKEAISIAEHIGFSKKLDWLYNRLSAAYYYKGDYEESLKWYIKTADQARKINNKNTLFEAYNGIASIYMARTDYNNTEKYYNEALVIANDLNDSSSIALIENNFGIMYEQQKRYNEALSHYEKALNIYKSKRDSSSIALTLLNIGGCNSLTGNYTGALNFYNEAREIFMRSNDKNNLVLCYTNIAILFSKKKDFVTAMEFLNKALDLSKETGRKELIKRCYEELADLYYKTGKYQKAYDYFEMYAEMKDSIFNEVNAKSINELQTKYDTERKENEIVRLNLQSEAQEARIKQQNIRTYFIATGLLMVLIIVLVVYRQYKITRRTNKELALKNTAIRKQKREIENQKLIVENQNKEITDSINYARQIQQAILPSDLLISKVLPNHFILYKPKAIVSGDFYFFAEKKDKLFIAAVDCTGHGVPGAFMSMIGHNLLTQIINEKDVTEPAEILNQLHKGVRHVLQQDTENAGNRDGMDIALLAIGKNFKEIEYAGANRPLYLIRQSKINETKGDKFPIGGLQYELERRFTSHTIQIQSGDSIYLFSDGYADQFGGEKGKKFMVKSLQKTLLDVSSLPLHNRKSKLDSVIESWRGNLEQIDDILVIGIEI